MKFLRLLKFVALCSACVCDRETFRRLPFNRLKHVRGSE
jgi:hypothetical protein